MPGIRLDETNVDAGAGQLLRASLRRLDRHRRIPHSVAEKRTKTERACAPHFFLEEFPFHSRSGDDHSREDFRMPHRDERTTISALRESQEEAFARLELLVVLYRAQQIQEKGFRSQQ